MLRLKGWEPIIEKCKKRLSRWKVSMLFIGGRLVLVGVRVVGYLLSFSILDVGSD